MKTTIKSLAGGGIIAFTTDAMSTILSKMLTAGPGAGARLQQIEAAKG